MTNHIAAFCLMANIAFSVLLATWVTFSVYYAYPHISVLQTTSYELEAISYIHETTNQSYVVICDIWTSYAGQMMVGASNEREYYFPDTEAAALFTEMRKNPSADVMLEAMNLTNATVAYFMITKPRLGAEEYNRVIEQAQDNGLKTYAGGVLHYQGVEKLRIFYLQRA